LKSEQPWKPEDVAFAAIELRRESLAVHREDIIAAVEAAGRQLAPDAGRVQLMVKARQILRKL
jgi:hypothetical protein